MVVQRKMNPRIPDALEDGDGNGDVLEGKGNIKKKKKIAMVGRDRLDCEVLTCHDEVMVVLKLDFVCNCCFLRSRIIISSFRLSSCSACTPTTVSRVTSRASNYRARTHFQ
jgi:hypothetical protein